MTEFEVKAIKNFYDKVENKNRFIGDIFKCNKERFDLLVENKAVELIKITTNEITINDEEIFTEEEINDFKEDEVAEIEAEVVKVKPTKKKKNK